MKDEQEEITIGLDHYLTMKKGLYPWNKEEKETQEKIQKLFPKTEFKVKGVEFEIITWRKANAIHKWFVDNVQEGNDDCKEYYVSLEDLQKLLDTINEVFGKNDKEKIINKVSGEYNYEAMPTCSGFFFGGTDYDDYYIDILKETKEMLIKILDNKEEFIEYDFYYSSSW